MGKGRGILLDENGELVVKNGSVVIGNTTNQEIHLIITMNKGEMRTHPLLGAGVYRLVKSRSTVTKIKRDIEEELRKDGFNQIRTDTSQFPVITITASR